MNIALAMAMAVAALVLMATLPSETEAQFDCRNEIASLSPCYGYLEGRDFYPASGCCSRLVSVVETRSDCLCEVLRGGNQGVNQTRFLELPTACGVRSPLLGNCNYYAGGTPPYFSNRPPYGEYNPYYSGYSTKILDCMLVSVVVIAASCAIISITI